MSEWSSPDMALVAETIREWTGLTFPEARRRDVEATVSRAMARKNVRNAPRFLQLLQEDAPARDALVAELTIGETYFQRDPAQFALLRERLLPELLAGRPPERPVRVWSAGCASGEEPYTVAMLFDELDALRRAHIVGTDIARPRLEDAQRGIYSKWSLRNTDAEVRAKYFRERGRFYELTPRLRTHVDFRYLNLAEDRFPSLSIGIWGMDVILCRNVLIYFDAPTVAKVARRLLASLSEDGWLILGASDPAIAEMVECDVVLTDSGVVYRRAGAAGDADMRRATLVGGLPGLDVEAPEAAPVDAVAGDAVADPLEELLAGLAVNGEEVVHADAGDDDVAGGDAGDVEVPVTPEGAALAADAALLDAYASRDFDRVIALAEAAADGSLGVQAWLLWVRALANQGCLEDAMQVATRAAQRHGPNAELLFLDAVLLLQGGRAADAALLARRALYLDRRMIVAHMALADAEQRTGNVDAAQRSLRNAAVLLAELAPDAYVPASDGETAGRLAELVRVRLRLLNENTRANT